jgi:serine phosphatase RsbU (regulator of sigma subunit)
MKARLKDQTKEELLARTPILRGLPAGEIQRLADFLSVKELPPDSILFREGEIGDRFYIVIQGQLEVIKALGTLEERLIGVRGPGEFIGEQSLINRTGLRTATIRSTGQAYLWEMSRSDFDRFLRLQPSIAYEMLEVLGDRLTIAHDASIKDLQAKNRELQRAYDELKAAQAQIIEKERLERELQLASEIQKGILPQILPHMEGYNFGTRMMPARAVGGDFYDVFSLGEHKMGILIGDVADKGVPAAIFMAKTHALVYAEAKRIASPVKVLQRVNQHLIRIGEASLFVTILYGVLDSRTREFAYARAGHELPILMNATGQAVLAAQGQGQLMGVLEDPVFDNQILSIPPGGTLLLYTDGILDARNPRGAAFGLAQLMDNMPALAGRSAQEVCDRLWQRITGYKEDAPQDDDVTLVAVHSTD